MRYHFPKHAATSAIPEQWASFGEKGKLAPTPPNPYPNTAVHTSLVLTYPWGFLKKMSLFSHIFVLLPFPLYSEQQSENQCHRGPRLSLGKEIQNESPRVLARKQSLSQIGSTTAQSHQGVSTQMELTSRSQDFECMLDWSQKPELRGKRRICKYVNSSRH